MSKFLEAADARDAARPSYVPNLRAAEARDKALLAIAKLRFEIDTLKSQRSDALDFHELAVWQLEAALNEAFQAGREAALDGMAAPTIGAR